MNRLGTCVASTLFLTGRAWHVSAEAPRVSSALDTRAELEARSPPPRGARSVAAACAGARLPRGARRRDPRDWQGPARRARVRPLAAQPAGRARTESSVL
eukprot:5889286-Pleurochrysis_carterae.AAC.2